VLERVGEEVEDDLLPHAAIGVHRLAERRAVDAQREAGALARRPEGARQLGDVRREIDRLVRRLDAAGLEPREVEQRVDELEQPERVAVHDLELLALRGLQRTARTGEQVGRRPEHERERCAELVAHVGEELRLGAIQLGERFGAAALFLIRLRVAERDGDLRPKERVEGSVPLVERAARAHAGDDRAERQVVASRRDRHHERGAHGILPRSTRDGGARRDVVEHHRRAGGGEAQLPGDGRRVEPDRPRALRALLGKADHAAQGERRTVGVARVDEREGDVERVGPDRCYEGVRSVFDAARVARTEREIAQQLESPLAEDLLGHLAADAEHAADDARVVLDGAVREAEVRFLAIARALEGELLCGDPVGDAGGHHGVDHRADGVPRFRLRLADRAAEGVRVLVADQADVRVVVDLDQLRPPEQDHRVARREERLDRAAQTLGPRGHWAHGSL